MEKYKVGLQQNYELHKTTASNLVDRFPPSCFPSCTPRKPESSKRDHFFSSKPDHLGIRALVRGDHLQLCLEFEQRNDSIFLGTEFTTPQELFCRQYVHFPALPNGGRLHFLDSRVDTSLLQVWGQNYPGALCNVTYSLPVACSEVTSKIVAQVAKEKYNRQEKFLSFQCLCRLICGTRRSRALDVAMKEIL